MLAEENKVTYLRYTKKENVSQGFYIQPNLLWSKKDAYKLLSTCRLWELLFLPWALLKGSTRKQISTTKTISKILSTDDIQYSYL